MFDEKEVRNCYKFLEHLNETEIRLIDPKKVKEPLSIFVKSEDEFVKVCKEYNGKYNLYVGINERQPNGTTKKDVISVKTVIIDIDAVREKGFEKQPATNDELRIAEKITDNIIESIKKTEQQPPVKLCSGNGYQLWFAIPEIKIDDYNRQEIEDKLQLFQDAIINKFDINGAIDKIGDLPRIIKIWGSYNIKGNESKNRSYRVARVVSDYYKRIENESLKKQILALEKSKIPEYENVTLESLDLESIPPCVNHILKYYENKDGKYWYRLIQFLSSFFMSIGLKEEVAIKIILDWNKKQPYHETNEEHEILSTIKRIYNNKINIPNCKKIRVESGGFPFFGLADLKICKADGKCNKCINPVIRYKRATEKEDDITQASSIFVDKLKLAELFYNKQPFFYDKSKLWWFWNNSLFKWEQVDETDLLNSIGKNSQVNTINSKERNEIIESLKQVGRKKIPKNMNPSWIQFKEQVVDINTGNKFIATPEYFVTNPIPWALNENNFEQTPILDKIFEEWVGKDYLNTLYEILAYCLLPDYPINRLFCFVGSGMNGKSKFLELLRKFIGADNCCSTELDTLINSRFEITRLHKKLVCQMGETNFNEISKTSIIKKLTGGDLIGFEYKNKNPFEEKNYAKIIIATNNLPTTTDKTIGFYRRWMIIDFPNQFSEQKDILAEIPEEEYECLALKCCGILKDLLVKRGFHKEGSVEERMERYETKSDFLQKFLDEFTELNVNEDITKTDFYKKFSDWCKENRHRQMAENTLGKKMKDKNIEEGRRYVDWLYDGKGGQIRVWRGIKWKN